MLNETAATKTAKTVKTVKGLHVPQFRVLKTLMPNAKGDKPFLVRVKIAAKAGFSPISGMVQTALAGRSSIPGGGLIGQGMVKRTEIELDGGTKEVGYQITTKGIKAVETFLAEHGKAPKTRETSLCVNKRYKDK